MTELEQVIREAVDRGFAVRIWKEYHVIICLTQGGKNWVYQVRKDSTDAMNAAVIHMAMNNFEHM